MLKERVIWAVPICVSACLTIVGSALLGLAEGQDTVLRNETMAEDPNALVRNLIIALDGLKQPTTGRGTARVTASGNSLDEMNSELVAEFVFKKQKMRTDSYELVHGTKGVRKLVEVRNDRVSLGMNEQAATVQDLRGSVEADQFFHPDVFLKLNEAPITDILRKCLDLRQQGQPVDLEARVNSEGMLDLSIRYAMPPGNMMVSYGRNLSFDMRKEFRPVFGKFWAVHADGKEGWSSMALQWKKYDSVWYVSHVELKWSGGRRHEIAVSEFWPNVEVSDTEFELAGIGIPEQTWVMDYISQVQYRYGTPLDVDALAKSIEEAEFATRIKERHMQGSVPAEEPNSCDGTADSNRLSAPGGGLASPTTAADVRPASWYSVGKAWLACAVGVMLVAGILGYRHATARRRDGERPR